MKEYIVTLHRHEDLEDFYVDMETPGGALYIPNRSVDIAARRPNSRNTHYMLTDDEAEILKKDPRVLDVVPSSLIISSRRPAYSQTSPNWNKQFINASNHVNWGLLRCFEGSQRNDWGEDGTVSQSGTITINTTGKNVDVIIVDGHLDPSHPEFTLNSNGTGGTRVNQYNWYQHTNAITGGANGTYVYTPYVDGISTRTDDNNHGCHVAGTVAGNTQGWARNANIYNISPYASNQNNLAAIYLFDYIKEFHINKPIDPATGRKNPTILNCSFGSSLRWNYTDSNNDVWGPLIRITYRGEIIENLSGLTAQQMTDRGIYTTSNSPTIPYYAASDDVDIQDLIDLGVIIVASAGNDSFYTCNNTDQDWNNTYRASLNGQLYELSYHRGTAPATSSNVISVGAIGNTVDESKATFSNCGPGVDIYAPGRAIMSSLNNGGTTDPRNSNYRIGKYQGTSMASPQVCGVLACALEIYPGMNQIQAREYIVGLSKSDQITDTNGSTTDLTSLQGSPNRYLFIRQERPLTKDVFPKKNFKLRATTGAVWPRTRIRIGL